MFIAQLEDPSFPGRDLTSLRTGIMAGAPCPVEVMNRVIEAMGAQEITIGYGLTESSPVATQTRPDDPVKLRVESVGRAIPGVEVTIRDPHTGLEMPLGEQGEICIRGHNVMLGYHEMPDKTAETIDADGWLHTGDLGTQDAAGYVRVTGRSKDMIIRGGENIYPREIEEALYGYQPVEQVEVVGVPDERLGEEVGAWIRLRQGSDATRDSVREHCRAELAHFKVPRYVVFTTEFPTTASGKVQKFKLREQAAELLRNGELDDAIRHPA